MKRTTAVGSSGGLFVNRNPGTATPGTQFDKDDANNWQEEICHPILDAGFALDGADQYQLERAIVAFRKRIGEFDFQGAEIVPITVAASRSSVSPANPEYYPCIPRYDANHDVSATEVTQAVVDVFRAIKSKFKGVSDFAVTVAGSVVTLPATPASQAAIQAIINEAQVAAFLNLGQPASFGLDYTTTNATKQTVTINGTEYVVSSTTIGSYQITVVGSPSNGTLSMYPHRIAGSTTSFRLTRLGGFVPAAANDDDGQYSAGKRVMDRFEIHWHSIYGNSTGGAGLLGYTNENKTNAALGSAYTAVQAQTVVGDGTNTLRTGKTTDPRAFGTFIGTWVRTLLATTYTSA